MRAFIVGNGPSLSKMPLELLAGEVCYATNRINMIYPHTTWRPTHYARTETPNDDNFDDFWHDCKLHVDMGIRCIFPTPFKEKLGEGANIEYHNTCHHYKYNWLKAPHAWHFPMYCDYGTVLAFCIQHAVMSCCDQIILLGCDLGYDKKRAHFYDSSAEKRLPPAMANLNMVWAHMVAARECNQRGVSILNATVGGDLEVHPRVSLRAIL